MMAYEYETSEWRALCGQMTEAERAAYDDPQTYADTMDADGNRL